MAEFLELVDWVLSEHPNLSLLTTEEGEHGPIAVFRYQGDDVVEVTESGAEFGQFMTAAGGFYEMPDDPNARAEVDASMEALDPKIPPFVALIDVAYGEPIPFELQQQFAEIVGQIP